LLRWRQIDFGNEALTVGKSKTAHGTGRSVPLNRRAIETLATWALQFADRKPHHCVFPSEKVGVAGDDQIVSVFDTDPEKPITSWKTAWMTARGTARVECRFHDLRHTTVTRLLERGVAFAWQRRSWDGAQRPASAWRSVTDTSVPRRSETR
jgi:integrase